MVRFSAHYIYYEGLLHRKAVVEITSLNQLHIKSLHEEIANTEFYNGLIFILKSDEDTAVVMNRLGEYVETCLGDILQAFSNMEKDNQSSTSETHFLLFENIDLQQIRWIPESEIKELILKIER